MKRIITKILDFLFAAVFIIAAISSLRTFDSIDIDLPYIGILLAITYAWMAFGLIRSIPAVRFFIYVHSVMVVLMVFAAIVYLALNSGFYFPLLIPLVVYSLASIHCYQKHKRFTYHTHILREGIYFIIFLGLIVTILLLGDYFFQWGAYQTKNLSGPIGIKK